MSRDLAAEVRAFLVVHGPAQAKTIGVGVRARLSDVAAVLALEGFSQAKRPVGAHPHSVYWVASRRVRQPRKVRLLEILADGEWHSRAAIARAAGPDLFLTNNAAAECRAAGHVVEFSAKRGYRLVSPAVA